jgi:hypothetical protein
MPITEVQEGSSHRESRYAVCVRARGDPVAGVADEVALPGGTPHSEDVVARAPWYTSR